ncbi:MAG: MBL fold metallo-hydrolase [Deltaproteobacteria bacterium]|nr:MBL fold metallo-hydrolase [Deltaproteobacteria bacterium]
MLKRTGWLVGLALGLSVLWSCRAPIALRVMDRALARNMRADPIAALPDGLHVLLCGAGGPLPDPVRSGPCAAVIAGGTLVVVDAGTGGARNLQRMGFVPGRTTAVFLTHFHSDHIDGLGELALLRWTGGAHADPLPVHGPNGVEEIVAGFTQAYRRDVGYRVAHHGEATVPPSGAGMRAIAFPLPAEGEAPVVFSANGLEVRAFAVDHAPVEPAVGYRFDYRGRSVLISGDTAKSANLEARAKGVDLLVHEALSPELVGRLHTAAENAGRANLAKITADIPDYHTSPVEAAQIARSAGVDHLLFYHVVPPLPVPGLEGVFLAGVSKAFDGDVTLGRDGTLVSLPSGSDAIEVDER